MMDVAEGYGIAAMLEDYQRSFQLERWLHPTRFPEGMTPALYRLLRSAKRTKEAVEVWLWEHLKLRNDAIPRDLESRWDLAFIGAEKIGDLQLYLGAYCESEAIARVILGSEVVALKQSIGEAVYHFVLYRVPLLSKLSVPLFPEAIQEKPSLPERIRQKGKWMLESLLADAPAALLERFVLQFPREWAWDFSHKPSREERTFCEGMAKIILEKVMALETQDRGEKNPC
ncbi:MAG: SctK family type III secretion system sorting platform protein [Puniceicoccales bacterium]|nr:SctK family type III secretion system sorting platform protein [Puniceicoccales bacterium]